MNYSRHPGERHPPAAGPLALFREPGFVCLWFTGALTSTVRWLEMLAVGIFVFDLTSSPLAVALLTVLRMVPLALLGMVIGALAERVDRKRMLLVGLLIMSAVTLTLALLVLTERVALWHIALGSLLGGVFWTTDMPVRRTLLGELAGPERVGSAMAFDAVTNNGTRLLGPLLGGLLLEIIGMGGTYLLGTVLYLAGFIALVRFRLDQPPAPAHRTKVLASIIEGVRQVRANRALVGTLVVTMIFNLWGFPFTAMIPVIGKDELGLSPFPIGLLASAEGAGASVGAMVIAFFAQPRFYRKLYVYGMLIYLAMVLAFALSSEPAWAGLVLLVAGLGGAAFSTMQSTLVFISAPPELRARMMGLLSVCIGTAPLGFLHLGLLANALGAPLAVTISAVEGLVALALAYWWWPEIR